VVLTSRDVRGSSAVLTAAGVAAILLGVLGLQIAEKMSKCKIRKDLNESLDEALKDSVGFSHSIRKQ
jgi:hypothetical protein